MYLCHICNNCSEPGQPIQKHIIYRQVPYTPSANKMQGVQSVTRPVRSEIAKEIPVCNECAILLIGGIPLHMLLRQRGQPKRMGTCEPIDNRAQDYAKKLSKDISQKEFKVKGVKVNGDLTNGTTKLMPVTLTPEQRKQAAIDKFKAEIANKTTK